MIIGIGIFVALIILTGIGVYIYLLSQPAFGPEEPIPVQKDVELNLDNTQLYTILAQAGITNALVDVQEKEVLIALTIPEGQEKEDVLSFIYGTATGYAPTAETITVHVIINNTLIEEYTVTTENVVKYADGKITKEEFDKKVTIKTISTN